MCLYSEKRKMLVARKPIRCLKVVRRDGDAYVSALYVKKMQEYRIGGEYNAEGFDSDVSERFGYWERGLGFHSYTLKNLNVSDIITINPSRYTVLLCEIPVGTRYAYGYSNTMHAVLTKGFMSETSYVSERIRVLRELSKEEIEKIGLE